MIMKVFTVFDSKAAAFLQPFFSQSTGAAVRAFSDAVNSTEHQFHRHAGDFTLYELGTFDDSACKFELLPGPQSLGSAVQFLVNEPADARSF